MSTVVTFLTWLQQELKFGTTTRYEKDVLSALYFYVLNIRLSGKQTSKQASQKKKPTTLEQNKNQSCDFITVKVIDVWVIYGIDFKERKT